MGIEGRRLPEMQYVILPTKSAETGTDLPSGPLENFFFGKTFIAERLSIWYISTPELSF